MRYLTGFGGTTTIELNGIEVFNVGAFSLRTRFCSTFGELSIVICKSAGGRFGESSRCVLSMVISKSFTNARSSVSEIMSSSSELVLPKHSFIKFTDLELELRLREECELLRLRFLELFDGDFFAGCSRLLFVADDGAAEPRSATNK